MASLARRGDCHEANEVIRGHTSHSGANQLIWGGTSRPAPAEVTEPVGLNGRKSANLMVRRQWLCEIWAAGGEFARAVGR